MPASRPSISKTDFLNYLICPGYAWCVRHQPHLLPPPDDSARRRMRDGQVVEQLARQIFPPGETIFATDGQDADSMTRHAMAAGAQVLYQPTVISETGLMARADVLIRTDEGWHLIEVKSSSTDPEKPAAAVKKHINDITFQVLAFRQAGLPVVQASLLFLNRTFRRNGEVKPDELFVLVDVTADVMKHQLALQPQINDAVTALLDSRSAASCDCHRKTRANRCELFNHFHAEIPERDTIYNIASIQRGSLLPALDRGVMMIVDWPDDLELSARQRRQVEVARSGVPAYQREKLSGFLQSMTQPLWYLDYETFQSSIPRWEGHAPHQQITFQYSLHRWDTGGEPEEFGYLAESAEEDPSRALVTHLMQHLGDTGSVVVWNKSFEHGRNVEIAQRYPEFAAFLDDINRRMIDLADMVKHGWWESPAFQGSWSLKQVLPVAAPELNYKYLAIGDGGTASERWMQAVLDSPCRLSDTERQDVLNALRIYCAQDTLAMHRIREYIVGLLA